MTGCPHCALQVLAPSVRADFELLTGFKDADADLEVVSCSTDNTVWLVAYVRDDAATEYYMFDRCAAPCAAVLQLVTYKQAFLG